jgi:tRNA(Ile)-lysidine synthase
LNHGARGRESEEDQRFVERMSRRIGLPLEVGKVAVLRRNNPRSGGKGGKGTASFEERARKARYAFLLELKDKHHAKKLLIAHTADDQVETVLMRILEGAGITGLKGIPRSTGDGIERPLLDIWREDILKYLKKHKIPSRVDKSNLDTRFERNWVRHVLLPLVEKRYGKSVKKRIFTLGERFRELDAFIELTANIWLENNNIFYAKGHKSGLPRPDGDGKEAIRIPREAYAKLPSLLRIRILQILCFERIGKAPNERLLESMDRLIVSGGPSARLSVGRGATLRCRYEKAVLSFSGKKEKTAEGARRPAQTGKGKSAKGPVGRDPGRKIRKKTGTPEPVMRMEGPGMYTWNASEPYDDDVPPGSLRAFQWKEQGKIAPERMRRLANGERCAAFDKEMVASPLSVRPLRAGDRIRPFGLNADKKVKEILIDRKVPREERWGRPVVCDAEGKILWIPGVVRAAHAPVTPKTRRTVVLRAELR